MTSMLPPQLSAPSARAGVSLEQSRVYSGTECTVGPPTALDMPVGGHRHALPLALLPLAHVHVVGRGAWQLPVLRLAPGPERRSRSAAYLPYFDVLSTSPFRCRSTIRTPLAVRQLDRGTPRDTPCHRLSLVVELRAS